MSGARREAPSLGTPGDLTGFPVWHVLRGAVLHRVTDAGRGPWWFASDGGGRFDLDAPRGTCYLADDAVVALLEVLGAAASAPVLAASLFDDRVVWSVALPEQCDAADTTTRRARALRRHRRAGDDRDVPPASRAWAAAFAGAGLGGVRYRARHDPGGGRCLALFGAAGERRRWRRGRSTPVAGALLTRLRDEAGVVLVGGRPHDDELDPPVD